ncbi:MAG TPA: hypothetical protein PK624_12200 [Spirochaetota bacterium]|nr:hypothetical protein [Spirochaetota bacterium]HOR45544.1 hypothetical protein [Spirochaetota bacterium]HPK57127.1 hypothetical protein [Spirochaetota bacterium]
MIKRIILIIVCSVVTVFLFKDLYVSKSLVLEYRIDLLENSSTVKADEITARIYYKENNNSLFDKNKSIVQKHKVLQPNDITVSIPLDIIYGLKIELSDIPNRIKLSEFMLKGKTKLSIENLAEIARASNGFVFEKTVH